MSVDIATVYNQFGFLGSEFLLWLLWASENDPATVNKLAFDNEKVSLEFGGAITIENEKPKSKITINSDDAGKKEAAIAISEGGRIKEASFVLAIGEEGYSFSITSSDLALKGLKTPKVEGFEDEEDELEDMILEKIYLDQRVLECIDAFYKEFLTHRVSAHWGPIFMPQIIQWLSETTGFMKNISYQPELFTASGQPSTTIEDDTNDRVMLEDETLETSEA